ncbi:MAG: glutathione binding-like protein, partial [Gammaproteobacteria bacterium]
ISSELHKGFGVLWHPPVAEADKQYGVEKLKQRFTLLDKHLANNEFLMGKQFTVADAYAYTIISWSYFHKLDLNPYPHLRAYMKRIAERPSVRNTAHEEKLAA